MPKLGFRQKLRSLDYCVPVPSVMIKQSRDVVGSVRESLLPGQLQLGEQNAKTCHPCGCAAPFNLLQAAGCWLHPQGKLAGVLFRVDVRKTLSSFM